MKVFKSTVLFAMAGMPAMVSGRLFGKEKADCVTIPSGKLLDSVGETIEPGYDKWGHNYQSHIFNGKYCDNYRDAAWCQEWKTVDVIMKWNDAWLSNMDCDDDGLLDRSNPYKGSGAWVTNHQSDVYVDGEGKSCKWTWFVKIVAVPSDADLIDGVWWASDDTEIGYDVEWGAFAAVQDIFNDPCGGAHGVYYKAARPGLGNLEDEGDGE